MYNIKVVVTHRSLRGKKTLNGIFVPKKEKGTRTDSIVRQVKSMLMNNCNEDSNIYPNDLVIKVEVAKIKPDFIIADAE